MSLKDKDVDSLRERVNDEMDSIWGEVKRLKREFKDRIAKLEGRCGEMFSFSGPTIYRCVKSAGHTGEHTAE